MFACACVCVIITTVCWKQIDCCLCIYIWDWAVLTVNVCVCGGWGTCVHKTFTHNNLQNKHIVGTAVSLHCLFCLPAQYTSTTNLMVIVFNFKIACTHGTLFLCRCMYAIPTSSTRTDTHALIRSHALRQIFQTHGHCLTFVRPCTSSISHSSSWQYINEHFSGR